MNRKMDNRKSFTEKMTAGLHIRYSKMKVDKHNKKNVQLGFLVAIELGDRESFDRFMENGVDCRYHRDIALVAACRYEQLEMAEILIGEGCDINCQNNRPLREASELNLEDTIDFLIEKGIDVTISNDFAVTRAARYGNFGIVMKFVERGANLGRLSNDMTKRLVTSPAKKVKLFTEETSGELVELVVKEHCRQKRCNALEEFEAAPQWLKPYYMRHLFN